MADFFDSTGRRHYRRGVVLGLSLAEVFTVLVFLLLLVLSTYVVIQDRKLAESQELTDDQRDVLTTLIAENDGNEIVPALPSELQRINPVEALRRISGENRRLRDKLETSGTTKATIEHDDAMPPQTSVRTTDQWKRQEKAVDALTREIAALYEQIRQLNRGSEDDPSRNFDQEIEELNAKVSDLEEANIRLRNEIINAGDRKGQDSPCWFRLATRANGEPYERASYIFNVRIADADIYVQDIPPPTEAYREQKKELKFDRNALNRSLRDDEFIDAFQTLKLAGENHLVRNDRRCTFYVAVWDATSETNKRRYKHAHNDIVGAVFNTYEYRQKPWPADALDETPISPQER